MKALILSVLSFGLVVSCVEVHIQEGEVLEESGGGVISQEGLEVVYGDGGPISFQERNNEMLILLPNSCVCQNGEPISVGDCSSVCSHLQAPGDLNKTLYFDLAETQSLAESYLKDLDGFCSTETSDVTPQCTIEFKDENGNTGYVPFEPSNDWRQSVNVQHLKANHTYRFTIVEKTSKARSTTAQVRIYNTIDDQKTN